MKLEYFHKKMLKRIAKKREKTKTAIILEAIDTNIYLNQKGYILPDDAVTLPVTNKSLSFLSLTSIAMVSRI